VDLPSLRRGQSPGEAAQLVLGVELPSQLLAQGHDGGFGQQAELA